MPTCVRSKKSIGRFRTLSIRYRTEPNVDPRRDEQDEVRAQIGEDRLEDDDHAHRDAKHHEGVEASVVDHLVGQETPEDDRREREQTYAVAQITRSLTIRRSRRTSPAIMPRLKG